MGKADDADLRKEVEMTEHTDSVEKVCQQYKTNVEHGLTESDAEEVIFNYCNHNWYPIAWLTLFWDFPLPS